MSRAAVYSLLISDSQLSAMGFGTSNIVASNSLDDFPGNSFMVLRWEDVQTRWLMANKRGKQTLTVWVHEKSGDYARINAALDRVKDVLTAAVQVTGSDGKVLTQCDWRGESGDLYDDGYKTITRYASFEVVAREG